MKEGYDDGALEPATRVVVPRKNREVRRGAARITELSFKEIPDLANRNDRMSFIMKRCYRDSKIARCNAWAFCCATLMW